MIRFLTILLTFIVFASYGQDKPAKKVVYKKINYWVTVPIIVGGTITNYYGVRFLKSKPGLDSATVINLTPDDVNAFDRGAARQEPNNAKNSDASSTLILGAVNLLPIILGADKNIRSDGLKISLIYLETMAVMANAYSWGVGNINRKRPYVFNPKESIARRTRKGSFNSFYGGHSAAAAASTFFIAKVFSDYYPDSKWRPFIYGAALIPPAIVGYFRYKAGMHFPSDIIAGIAGGAFIGTIIPHLHKQKNKNLSLTPLVGPCNGLAMTFRF